MGSFSASDIRNQSQDKQRIVIAGSSGTHWVATLIIHVLKYHHRGCDFVLTRPLPGTDESIHLSDAPLVLIESPGTSGVSREWSHHIGVLTGFSAPAADEDALIREFDAFADATPKSGILVFNETDRIVTVICTKERPDVLYVPYKSHPHAEEVGASYLVAGNKDRIPFAPVSKEVLLHVSAAKEVLKKIGITSEQFYQALPGFRAA